MYIPSFKLISQSMLKQSPENSDGRTDRRTDGHCHSIIRPFFKRAYKNWWTRQKHGYLICIYMNNDMSEKCTMVVMWIQYMKTSRPGNVFRIIDPFRQPPGTGEIYSQYTYFGRHYGFVTTPRLDSDSPAALSRLLSKRPLHWSDAAAGASFTT